MHTFIWCLLGGLKCLHASILSILEDIPLGRLRKELPYQENKGLPASHFSGQGDDTGNWPMKAGLGTRCSHHHISQAQLSSPYISHITRYIVLQIKEGPPQVLKTPHFKVVPQAIPKDTYCPLFNDLLTNYIKTQRCSKMKAAEKPQNICDGNYLQLPFAF